MKAINKLDRQMIYTPSRLRFTLGHFFISIFIGLIAYFLVFYYWYPQPFDEMAGGRDLFFILVSIDVIIGPVLTSVAASPKKLSYIILDLLIISTLQLSALTYGLYTMYAARPVYMVFEIDRFRVLSAADIDRSQLSKALPSLQILPANGPKFIAARAVQDNERFESLSLTLQGIELAMRPDRWTLYQEAVHSAKERARAIEKIIKQYPETKNTINTIAQDKKITIKDIYYLPTIARKNHWVTLINIKNAEVIGYLPVDGFI
jgi:hypothetical protein